MQSKHEKKFWELWPACLESIQVVSGDLMALPDNRYESVKSKLKSLHNLSTTNEIEKVLKELWSFDQRFHGGILSFASIDFEWAIYSLCYLCKDREIIKHLLNIYILLLGNFIKDKLGMNFYNKTGTTLMGDVGHYLWEIQGLIEPEDHGLFDWHGNRNQMSVEHINNFLQFADISSLSNPDFPPRYVLLHFTNLQDPFSSEKDYLNAMEKFYSSNGYSIRI